MIKITDLLLINLISFKLLDNDFINDNFLIIILLGVLVFASIIVFFIKYFRYRHKRRHKHYPSHIKPNMCEHRETEINPCPPPICYSRQSSSKIPECKSSNDELITLISEYKKKNKSGE